MLEVFSQQTSESAAYGLQFALSTYSRVFLTVDKNLPHQQKIENLPFAVVVLRSKSNRLADVVPFAPELLRRLSEFEPGKVYVLSNPA